MSKVHIRKVVDYVEEFPFRDPTIVTLGPNALTIPN